MVVITRLTHRISIGQPSYLVDMSLVRYTDKPISLISYPAAGRPGANGSFRARAASGFCSRVRAAAQHSSNRQTNNDHSRLHIALRTGYCHWPTDRAKPDLLASPAALGAEPCRSTSV